MTCDCVSSKITVELFADNAKLYTTSNDNIKTCCDLQSRLAEIFNWAEHWQLKLSPNKCAVMRLTAAYKRSALPVYSMNGVVLPVITHMC
jgi:Holliday junction resolvasome RuvABC endonuclease subunit